MRDDIWLNQRLDQIWLLLFPELAKLNKVKARFKGHWKNKFGHIKLVKNKDTEIAINSIFKDQRVPEYIIDITLAHELVHYMHGFNSPHQRKYRHPHKGGIVDKELINRGFGHLIVKEKRFCKEDWTKIYPEYCKPRIRRLTLKSFFRF